MICSSNHNFHVFGMNRTLDLSDKVFECLLIAMAKVQPVERNATFLFVGDINAHHEEWLGSSAANLHSRAVRDFALSSGSQQINTEPIHIDEEVLDLVLTEVPDIAEVRVGLPVGT